MTGGLSATSAACDGWVGGKKVKEGGLFFWLGASHRQTLARIFLMHTHWQASGGS